MFKFSGTKFQNIFKVLNEIVIVGLPCLLRLVFTCFECRAYDVCRYIHICIYIYHKKLLPKSWILLKHKSAFSLRLETKEVQLLSSQLFIIVPKYKNGNLKEIIIIYKLCDYTV